MKSNIHPQFYEDAVITCNCGNTFITGSTKKQITVEVCHRCHPFYTGEQRYIDTKGKVDQFEKKRKAAESYVLKIKAKKEKVKEKVEKKTKSLKELLSEI